MTLRRRASCSSSYIFKRLLLKARCDAKLSHFEAVGVVLLDCIYKAMYHSSHRSLLREWNYFPKEKPTLHIRKALFPYLHLTCLTSFSIDLSRNFELASSIFSYLRYGEVNRATLRFIIIFLYVPDVPASPVNWTIISSTEEHKANCAYLASWYAVTYSW